MKEKKQEGVSLKARLAALALVLAVCIAILPLLALFPGSPLQNYFSLSTGYGELWWLIAALLASFGIAGCLAWDGNTGPTEVFFGKKKEGK